MNFNFDGKRVPVKSVNMCISCVHFNRLFKSNPYIGFCSYVCEVLCADTICPINKYSTNILNRQVYIVFCDKVIINSNLDYNDTGVGLTIGGNFTDEKLLIDIKANFIKRAIEVYHSHGKTEVGVFEPVIFAEYKNNKWELIFHKFSREHTLEILNNLNNNSNNNNNSSTGI